MCNHNSPRFSRGHDTHVMPLASDSGFKTLNTCTQHNVSCYRTRSLHTNVSLSQRVTACHQQSASTWTWRAHVSTSLHLEVTSDRPRFFEVFLFPSWRLTLHSSQFFNIAVVAKTNRLFTSYHTIQERTGFERIVLCFWWFILRRYQHNLNFIPLW